jgi:rhomboid family protein
LFPLKDNLIPRRFPVITITLIAINVAIFLFFQNPSFSFSGAHVNDQKVVEYGLIPYEVTHPGDHCRLVTAVNSSASAVACQGKDGFNGPVGDQIPTWATLFTSMFMHGGILHLLGNMLFLWIFGSSIEDSMSPWRFPLFYLLGGAVAGLLQVLITPDSAAPTIGASGAIAAVLGGYALLYPRARVVTLIFIIIFFTVIELPALLVLGAWFLLQLFYASADLTNPASGGGSGVAYFAHIGGFAAGLALIRLFANRVHHDYDKPRLPVY